MAKNLLKLAEIDSSGEPAAAARHPGPTLIQSFSDAIIRIETALRLEEWL